MRQLSTFRPAGKRFRNPSDSSASKLNPFAPASETEPTTAGRQGPSRRGIELRLRRESLLALQARLKGDVARADDSLGNTLTESAAAPDSVDYAVEAVEQDVAVSLLGSVTETLHRIDGALKRIDDGAYGRCEECNAHIPAARLEAIPYATCCVKCAAEQERAASSPESYNVFRRAANHYALADDEDAESDADEPEADQAEPSDS